MKNLFVFSFLLLAACGSKPSYSQTSPASTPAESTLNSAEVGSESTNTTEKKVAEWERISLTGLTGGPALSTGTVEAPGGSTYEVTKKGDAVETVILQVNDFALTIGYHRGADEVATVEEFKSNDYDLDIVEIQEMTAGYIVVSKTDGGNDVTGYFDEGFIFCKATGLNKEQMLDAISVCKSFEL